jgi:hypothetical protein
MQLRLSRIDSGRAQPSGCLRLPVRADLHSPHDTLELAQQKMTKKAESLTARVTDVLRAKGLAADSAVAFGDPHLRLSTKLSSGRPT